MRCSDTASPEVYPTFLKMTVNSGRRPFLNLTSHPCGVLATLSPDVSTKAIVAVPGRAPPGRSHRSKPANNQRHFQHLYDGLVTDGRIVRISGNQFFGMVL